jgi:hypothetical protein
LPWGENTRIDKNQTPKNSLQLNILEYFRRQNRCSLLLEMLKRASKKEKGDHLAMIARNRPGLIPPKKPKVGMPGQQTLDGAQPVLDLNQNHTR